MKKRILATLLCAVMSLSLLAGCGGSSSSADTNGSSDGDSSAPTGETYTMKMHLSIGETDPVYKSAQFFADTVHEKSNGAITVELYPSSSLGNTADCLEGLSLGICNIVYESIGQSGISDISCQHRSSPLSVFRHGSLESRVGRRSWPGYSAADG